MSGIVVVLTLIVLGLIWVLYQSVKRNTRMGEQLSRLQNEVSENSSAVDSAAVLLAGLANRLREALLGANLESEIGALADELDASTNRLAVAIAANTVAENDSDDIDAEDPDGEPLEPAPSDEPIPDNFEPAPTDDTGGVSNGGDSNGENEPAAGDDTAAGDSDTTTPLVDGDEESNA